jgi:hypothetical protein
MREILKSRKSLVCAAATVLLTLPAVPAAAAPPGGPDAEAISALRKMTDHVSRLPRFSVRAEGAIEVVLVSGQKLQFDVDSALTVERPNKLRATRKGEISDLVLCYDGSNVTFFDPAQRAYAVEAAPKNIERMLDVAREELDLVAPAADLIYADAFNRMTEGMTAGFVVSRSAMVHGQSSTHLAFRKPGVDVQIWIANAGPPLPLKYALTTTDVAGNPEYTLVFSDWNMSPQIGENTFRFTPPAGAKRIGFVRAGAAPASSK